MEYRKDDKILSIERDTDTVSPREWEPTGKMICFHRRYVLGDEHTLKSSDFSGWENIEEFLIKEEGASVVLPLYLYDHSGLRMKVGSFHGLLPQGHARWDSGQIGFIYATKDALKKWKQAFKDEHHPGLTDEQIIEQILISEVETYDQYLRGDIYRYTLYTVKKCNLGYEHREHIDSCSGFYGADWNTNGLLDHAGIESLDGWEEIKWPT